MFKITPCVVSFATACSSTCVYADDLEIISRNSTFSIAVWGGGSRIDYDYRTFQGPSSGYGNEVEFVWPGSAQASSSAGFSSVFSGSAIVFTFNGDASASIQPGHGCIPQCPWASASAYDDTRFIVSRRSIFRLIAHTTNSIQPDATFGGMGHSGHINPESLGSGFFGVPPGYLPGGAFGPQLVMGSGHVEFYAIIRAGTYSMGVNAGGLIYSDRVSASPTLSSSASSQTSIGLDIVQPCPVPVVQPPQGDLRRQCGGGLTLRFEVDAPAEYQWYKDDVAMEDSIMGSIIQGTDTEELFISFLELKDGGNYWCQATDRHGGLCGVVESDRTSVYIGADLNRDRRIDFGDYLEFLNWFSESDPRADFTGDGVVDFADYLEFLNEYDDKYC